MAGNKLGLKKIGQHARPLLLGQDMKTKRLNVAGKALDRIKRVLKQIFPEILALGKKGIGDRNDLASNGLRLDD